MLDRTLERIKHEEQKIIDTCVKADGTRYDPREKSNAVRVYHDTWDALYEFEDSYGSEAAWEVMKALIDFSLRGVYPEDLKGPGAIFFVDNYRKMFKSVKDNAQQVVSGRRGGVQSGETRRKQAERLAQIDLETGEIFENQPPRVAGAKPAECRETAETEPENEWVCSPWLLVGSSIVPNVSGWCIDAETGAVYDLSGPQKRRVTKIPNQDPEFVMVVSKLGVDAKKEDVEMEYFDATCW